MLNPLYSIATDGVIAYAEQIKEEASGKFQTEINADHLKQIKKNRKLAKAAL